MYTSGFNSVPVLDEEVRIAGEGTLVLLSRNVNRFRGGLVFKADRLLYHSTLGLRVIKKKKKHTGLVPRNETLRCEISTVCTGVPRS